MTRIGLTCVLIFAALAVNAQAQNYPTKPVRVVLTFPPGSVVDIVGRIYLQKLTEYWGQNVLADNRGGAGGTIGANIVAKAAPDGYTLLIHSSALTAAPAMYANLPYDTLKDYASIAPLIEQPNVLIVPPGSPLKSTADLLARARERPGTINFASAGVGSGTHLNLEKFKVAAKVNVTHVPYKGSGEVLIDIMGGRIDGYFAPISAGLANIQSGKVRGLAVTSKKRAKVLPDLPTIAESGVPNFEFTLWMGVWGPKGMSAPVVNKIATAIKRAGDEPASHERLVSLGNDSMSMTPAEFEKFFRSEVSETAVLLRAAGVKPQ